MKRLKLAILGATGHIAKNLIVGLSQNSDYELFLFARNLELLNEFIKREIPNNEEMIVNDINLFSKMNYDVVINCIGIGDPVKLRKAGGAIFKLAEDFDNLILNYLESYRESLYISFSNGVAYGSNFNTPADQNKSAVININNISPTDYYTISKINAEAKHRSFSNLNIVDLRTFGFFSKYIDLKTSYFLNDIVNSVKENKVFMTGSNDMVRDYIHPEDLLQIVVKCIKTRSINDVFDVYSLEPISKFQIIEFFKIKYNLNVITEKDTHISSVTGLKSNYYSLNRKSDMIGYRPCFTSMDSIVSPLQFLINT